MVCFIQIYHFFSLLQVYLQLQQYFYCRASQIEEQSKMTQSQLFRLTDPHHHPTHRFACLSSSRLLRTPQLNHQTQPQDPRRIALKFRYLHRLDSDAIDRKYQLLQRLKRITRVADDQTVGEAANRDKRYSIESYYIFNENEQIDRKYQFFRNTSLRNKSNDNIHHKAVPQQELLTHHLQEHRHFLQKFRPKAQTGSGLSKKRFRFNRKSSDRLKRFQ